MKLWDKGYKIDELIEEFTTGMDRELDMHLAAHDVTGSKAHAEMLYEVKLISKSENELLQSELDNIYNEIIEGKFCIDPGMEDVHSQVEFLLTRRLGHVGKKIHLGRSRNDQVLLDLRLYYRAQMSQIVQKASRLTNIFISQAQEYKDVLMPGYTHMQVAMVSSFGLWFSCYAESLIDDIQYALSTRKLINRNPLGTAAGYGSSIPLDRNFTTEKLNFDGMCINPINAQIGRGKTEFHLANALACFGLTLNKLASDICLFTNENYGFLSIPKEYTTGSSIMPHKKNPDVFELIRAKSNLLINLPASISQCINNLQTGYHRDFQILKELTFPGIFTCHQLLDLLIQCIPQLNIAPSRVLEEKYRHLFSVEKVNEYVKRGMAFREAYKKVGEEIDQGIFEASYTIQHTHLGSIGNLGLENMSARLTELLKQYDQLN